jgi:steroid 5-alpha reductase family enzyme
MLAVGGETLADHQLARFRANPGNYGQVCREGLWAWSRHPNYFFEWLHWFTYLLLALGSARWRLALSGPVLMLLFLYRLSGIPWTEAQSLRSRGDAYRRYQREVSAFIPLPPRRG